MFYTSCSKLELGLHSKWNTEKKHEQNRLLLAYAKLQYTYLISEFHMTHIMMMMIL